MVFGFILWTSNTFKEMRYIIPKGWHFSLPWIPRLYRNKISYKWEVEFDKSCEYNIGVYQLDWNKLVGVTNHLNPRKHSIRIAWRYYNGVIQLASYKEEDYKFTYLRLGEVELGKKAVVELFFSMNFVRVTVNDKPTTYYFEKKKWTWRLNPYFGGTRKAPHTMKLKLTKIE